MMLGTGLMLIATLAAQSTTSVDRSRADYLKCMRAHLYQSVTAKMPDAEFNIAVASACQAEQTAFHSAVVAFDRADGIKAADAKENADIQVADYIDSFKSKFADYIESNTVPPKE